MGDAKGPIFTAAVVTWGSSVAAGWQKKKTNAVGVVVGPTVAVFIMIMFLLLIAGINRRLGVTFAALIAVGSLAYNGVPLFAQLQSVQHGASAASSSTIPAPWVWPKLSIPTAGDIGKSVVGTVTGAIGGAIAAPFQGPPLTPAQKRALTGAPPRVNNPIR